MPSLRCTLNYSTLDEIEKNNFLPKVTKKEAFLLLV